MEILPGKASNPVPVQALLDRGGEDDSDDEDPTGGMIAIDGAMPGQANVILDADSVELVAKAGAWVPATLSGSDEVLATCSIGIFTHAHSEVRVVTGRWDPGTRKGTVLIVNAEPYDISLERGSIVAAAWAEPSQQEVPVGSQHADEAAQFAHIIEKPGAVDRMMEVELPTTEYYESLRADMTVRFPKADPSLDPAARQNLGYRTSAI